MIKIFLKRRVFSVSILVATVSVAWLYVSHIKYSAISIDILHDGRYVTGEPLLIAWRVADKANMLRHIPKQIEILRVFDDGKVSQLYFSNLTYNSPSIDADADDESTCDQLPDLDFQINQFFRSFEPGKLVIRARLHWIRYFVFKQTTESKDCVIQVNQPTREEREELERLIACEVNAQSSWSEGIMKREVEDELRQFISDYPKSRFRQYALFPLTWTPSKPPEASNMDYLVGCIDDLEALANIPDACWMLKEYAEWKKAMLICIWGRWGVSKGSQGPRKIENSQSPAAEEQDQSR